MEIRGIVDPSVAGRRCRCETVMPYYNPDPANRRFFRIYGYRHCCPTCGNSAVILPRDKVTGFVGGAVAGGIALGWLCLSETVRQFNGGHAANKLICVALILTAIGLLSLHLLGLTLLNRFRYPVTAELASGAGAALAHDSVHPKGRSE